MFKKEIRDLILAFCFLSFGGLILHLRIHPPSESLFFWIPVLLAAVNAFILPFLFNWRKTVASAYLFTWVTMIAGTVGMAVMSIITWNNPVTVFNIFFKSTFPDIIIMWAKIFIAHRMLRFHWPDGVVTGRQKKGS